MLLLVFTGYFLWNSLCHLVCLQISHWLPTTYVIGQYCLLQKASLPFPGRAKCCFHWALIQPWKCYLWRFHFSLVFHLYDCMTVCPLRARILCSSTLYLQKPGQGECLIHCEWTSEAWRLMKERKRTAYSARGLGDTGRKGQICWWSCSSSHFL